MFARIAFAAGLLIAAPAADAAERRWLITPEEAAMSLRGGPGPATQPMANGEGDGPMIVVKNPGLLDRMRSPVSILVHFDPGISGRPPDMKSLTVTLRGFFTIDITDRLREYVRDTVLAVEGADLPAGHHRIRMVIADTAGTLTARDMVLNVEAGP